MKEAPKLSIEIGAGVINNEEHMVIVEKEDDAVDVKNEKSKASGIREYRKEDAEKNFGRIGGRANEEVSVKTGEDVNKENIILKLSYERSSVQKKLSGKLSLDEKEVLRGTEVEETLVEKVLIEEKDGAVNVKVDADLAAKEKAVEKVIEKVAAKREVPRRT